MVLSCTRSRCNIRRHVLPVVECVLKHIVVLPNPDRIPSQDEHGSAVLYANANISDRFAYVGTDMHRQTCPTAAILVAVRSAVF